MFENTVIQNIRPGRQRETVETSKLRDEDIRNACALYQVISVGCGGSNVSPLIDRMLADGECRDH